MPPASGATATNNGSGAYKLHLCGLGNRRITGSLSSSPWLITAGSPVACSGNIEALLNHATVSGGGHPPMDPCCFARLFENCKRLTHAPALPATTLTDNCYDSMFYGCSGLTNAPALPATNLASGCYAYMFHGCTNLTHAPELSAATLANECCWNMFMRCTGLTQAPALPATTLAPRCYLGMFNGCTSLPQAPALPATNLANECYNNMFYGCTGIELNTAGPGVPWRIPDNATAAPDWNGVMLTGTSGNYTAGPVIGTTYYLASAVPEKPLFATDGTGFVIGDNAATIKIVNAESGIWYTVYKVDDLTQTNWTKIGSSIQATGSEVVFSIPRDPTVPRRFFKVAADFTAP